MPVVKLAQNTIHFTAAQLPFGQLDIDTDEVHLWLLDLQRLPVPAAPSAGQSEHRQRRFLQRFYLRLLLAAYLGKPAHAVKLAKTVSGKPYIQSPAGQAAPPLYFSLSHHADFQLIA